VTRLWHLSSRSKGDAEVLKQVAATVDDPLTGPAAEPGSEQAAADPAAERAAPLESAVGVTVVPGFGTARPNVWVRNEGTSEITGLAVTHVPRSGEPISVPASTQRLLPGEACVVALADHADGEVRVSGTGQGTDGRPVELVESAIIPVEQPAASTAEADRSAP
jgi:hypothetical protein